jgi:multisubunit Na+/H+ antiporter MnhB subunit
MTTIILRTASQLLVPLSLLFAMFIYFKGHQTPGGGFVGGLVLAVALIVHRMSHGRSSLRLVGRPFLTSRFGYIPLPGDGGYFEWTTVMAFDLGVVLVVAGVVVGMINALTEELE